MTDASNAVQCKASSGERSRQEGAAGEASRSPRVAILTTHHQLSHPLWVARTVLLDGWYEEFVRANRSYWRSLLWAWRLFRESWHFDAVVTGAEHIGQMFALMQSLFRGKASRRVHVMIDFPWAVSPSALLLFLKRIQMRIAIRSIDEIFALASEEEAERFTQTLHVPRGKFRFVPFHYSCAYTETSPAVSTGDYVFSGGDSKDYRTLLQAVAGAPYRTIICMRQREYFRGLEIPPNVEISTVSPQRFDELLAGARVVVIPLPANDIHTGGHTVIANAAKLGKPLIVLGRDEYKSYVEPGKTALLLPPGDSESLRAAIDRIFTDAEFAGFLSRNALAAAEMFSPETFFARVFAAVEEGLQAKR
jgi:glycosyltransferase involved in cell wall biosynthesis